MIFLEAIVLLIMATIFTGLMAGVIYPICTDRPLFYQFRKNHPTNLISELKVELKSEKEKTNVKEIINEIKNEKEQRN